MSRGGSPSRAAGAPPDRLPADGQTPLGREAAAALLMGLLLAAVTTWPLVLRLGEVVPGDLGDPLLQVWQLSWAGHAWLPGGVPLGDTNAWYPLTGTFAFSDPPLGYAPLAVGVTSVGGAMTRFGLVFLLTLALAWAGPYLLARALGVGRLAATVAGGAAAYAPWRLAHDGHLNVLSSGGVALSLGLLLHGYRSRRPGVVFAGWAVAAWQMTVTLALGVPFGTLLAVLAVVAGAVWVRRGRPALSRGVRAATAGGLGLLVGTVALRAAPYLRVAEVHPDAARTVGHLAVYSPPPVGLLAAPGSSWLWGELTAPLRESMNWAPEQTLHLGLVVVVLAIVGLGATAWHRSLRFGLALGVILFLVLALGVSVAGGRWTYLPLFELLPGWDGLRTPGRLVTFASLGLGLLGAMGLERVRHATTARTSGVWAVAVAAFLAGAVHVEGAGTTELTTPPEPPAVATEAPLLHLPSAETRDARYLFWSVGDGYPELVNGVGSFTPELLAEVREVTGSFPDPHSVAVLRELGVRTVVWHRELAAGTAWEEVGTRPVRGLGVARQEADGTVTFDLGPGR